MNNFNLAIKNALKIIYRKYREQGLSKEEAYARTNKDYLEAKRQKMESIK